MISQKMNGKAHRIFYEKAILQYVTKLMKEKTGKGPNHIRVKILEDIIEISMEEFLTDIEKCVLQDPENLLIIQTLRERLYQVCRKEFLEEVSKVLKSEVDVLHASKDFSQNKSKITLIIK